MLLPVTIFHEMRGGREDVLLRALILNLHVVCGRYMYTCLTNVAVQGNCILGLTDVVVQGNCAS